MDQRLPLFFWSAKVIVDANAGSDGTLCLNRDSPLFPFVFSDNSFPVNVVVAGAGISERFPVFQNARTIFNDALPKTDPIPNDCATQLSMKIEGRHKLSRIDPCRWPWSCVEQRRREACSVVFDFERRFDFCALNFRSEFQLVLATGLGEKVDRQPANARSFGIPGGGDF